MSSRRPSSKVAVCAVLVAGCFAADAEDRALVQWDGPDASPQPPPPDRMGPAAPPSATPPAAGPVAANCVSPEPGPYHPAGFAEPSQHGREAKLAQQDCRTCHGESLLGCEGAPSCDGCHDGGHPVGWRTDCTYCHGGELDDSGAPPRDLVAGKSPGTASFLAHPAHVQGTRHSGLPCSTCHEQPKDLLSPGHLFDGTPGKAEVRFAGPLASGGRYGGQGGCEAIYCHGNGRQPAAIDHDHPPMTCSSCHGYYGAPDNLTPTHAAHFDPALPFFAPVESCSECHAERIELGPDGEPVIVEGLALHVNGSVDLALPQEDGGDDMVTELRADGERRCNGTCHGAEHNPLGLGDTLGIGVWQR